MRLVVNGSEQEVMILSNLVNRSSVSGRIMIDSNLTNEALKKQYASALALLIPLRPGIQDKARFPHKIGEYLAAGRPIITTNYGEITHYFKDMDNALVADTCDVNEYSKKMSIACKSENQDELKAIGTRGKKTGQKYFDYRQHGIQQYWVLEKLNA